MPRIVRSQNPPPFGNYKKYTSYLRIDFDSSSGAASARTTAGRYTSNHLNLDRDLRAGKQDLERRLTELNALSVDIETDADLLLFPRGQRLVENLGCERQRICRNLAAEYADWW